MAADDPRSRPMHGAVLMVAYHFPPLAGSSGIQRTLRFVQQLPEFGWRPLVLSASPRAFERCNDDLLAEVPPDAVVERALALDSARHLAIGGRYVGAWARPDRWVSWKFDAVRVGMGMIRRHRPRAIWSTYPIATAHLIGAALARRSGLPWIADFRDPMAQDGYPADPRTWEQYRAIEQRAMERAACCTFTTPGAARVYRERYPDAAAAVRVLENGYDEASFVSVEPAAGTALPPLHDGAVTLLHSGIVYPKERDPTQLMQALALLRDAGAVRPGTFRVRFRAAVQEQLLHDLAARHGVEPYVEVLPPVGYRDALREMLRADALLVMQAGDCNEQIPAKLYEYLRTGRPVICLSQPEGDTYGVLKAAGLPTFARIDDAPAIARMLDGWLQRGPAAAERPDPAFVHRASRRARSAELAALLDAHAAR